MMTDIVTSIPYRAFHNGLRILRNLDADELLAAGALTLLEEWPLFERDPARFFIKAGDERAAAVWALIQARQPAALKATDIMEIVR